MFINKGKKISVIGAAMLPVMIVGGLYIASNGSIRLSKASAFSMSLNANNAPTLNNGEGTMVDEKNVTWEYYNASALNNGHITLNHQGYFGVKSNTAWGYTAISELTVNFTGGANSELWLLTSIDGIDWQEQHILTSGESTDAANNWRYVRFYCWADNTSPINVTSVSFGYECTGISSSDDVDLASASNVAAESNLVATAETTTKSPLGNSQEAVLLTREANNSYCEFYLPKTYNVLDLHTKVIEFDFYHKNNQNKPSVSLANSKKTVGSAGSYSGTKSNYRFTNINSDWWHIEIHITSLVVPAVSHSDTATTNDPVDRIRINSGNCVIDNLRIDCTPSNQDHPLGLYNNGNSFSVGGYFWYKVSWAGVLHSCVFTYDDDTIIEQEIGAAHPFYMHAIGAGTVLVTANLTVGYDRRTISVSKTFIVNA